MSVNTADADLEIPPLQDGDRLTADEFHRRYEAMTHIKNANLINGVVSMSSPVRNEQHAEPHALMVGWLHEYRRFLPGIRLGDNATLRIDDDNEPQPDALLRFDGEHGGRCWNDEEGYLRGVPELVVEVAASSARLDAGEKRELYRRIGVREYLLWRVLEDRIDWWELIDGTYHPMSPDESGVIRSRVFPGLWLDVPAILQGNTRQLSLTLETGLTSPEHVEFADRLNPAG